MNSLNVFTTANESILPWDISRRKNTNCIEKQNTTLELEKNTCPILPNRYPLNLLWTKSGAVYPTATTPFEPLGLAPASLSTSRMRSSILGIYPPVSELIGQFDKLTDHTGARSLSLPKGPSPNSIFIPSFTHLAPNYVFFIPCL